MAEKALSQIKEAEARAQAIMDDAQTEALRIIKQAEEEAADTFWRLSETGKRQAEETKRQARAAALADSAEFSKETEELCAALKHSLSQNRAAAVDAVAQSIRE